MPFDLARIAGIAAALAMAGAPLAPAAARYLDIPVCGDPGKISHVPVPGKAPRDPACPTGCHAVMSRRCIHDEPGD